MAAAAMEADPGKAGVVNALKLIYRAYDENSFLYGSNGADYAILMRKVSESQAQEMMEASRLGQQLFLNHPVLKLKTTPEIAISVVYALIMGVKNKDVLPNHMEVFDYMAEHLVYDIYA